MIFERQSPDAGATVDASALHRPVVSTIHHQPVVSTIRHEPVVSTVHHQPVASTLHHQPVSAKPAPAPPVRTAPPVSSLGDVW